MKIEPGSVQCSVQLEGSILSTRVVLVRQESKIKQCLPDELKQTILSSDSDIRQALIYQSDTLEYRDIVSERGDCSLHVLHQDKVDLNFNILERVVISREISLFPGIRVRRKDSRFRWGGMMGGIISEITGERALVDWDNSYRWHSLEELCPLDELVNPILRTAKATILQAALRERTSFLTKAISTKQLQSQFDPKRISENIIDISQFPIKKEVFFKVGDLVKPADLYHQRGTDTGIIELCTKDGEYIVWWESDNEHQISESFRTFSADELVLISSDNPIL